MSAPSHLFTSYRNARRSPLIAALAFVSLHAPAAAIQRNTDEDGYYDGIAACLSAIPDCNGDGWEDLVIGDPDPHLREGARGGFWVVSGLSCRMLRHEVGPVRDPWFGSSVIGLGDVDGDELADFVVGDTTSYPSNSLNEFRNRGGAGVVRVFLSKNKEVVALADDVAGRRFGAHLARVDDLDSDGVADFLVTAPRREREGNVTGRIYAYSGKSRAQLFQVSGDFSRAAFHSKALVTAVASQHKLHRLLMCSVFNNTNVAVFDLGAEPKYLYTIGHPDSIYGFGTALTDLGDVNGDDWPDFAVGAPEIVNRPRTGPGPEQRLRGRVVVVSGKDGKSLWEIDNHDEPGGLFGTSLCVSPDVSDPAARVLFVGASPAMTSGDPSAVHSFSVADCKPIAKWSAPTPSGQQMVVLRGPGTQLRLATSHCDCDIGGLSGCTSIVDPDEMKMLHWLDRRSFVMQEAAVPAGR